ADPAPGGGRSIFFQGWLAGCQDRRWQAAAHEALLRVGNGKAGASPSQTREPAGDVYSRCVPTWRSSTEIVAPIRLRTSVTFGRYSLESRPKTVWSRCIARAMCSTAVRPALLGFRSTLPVRWISPPLTR